MDYLRQKFIVILAILVTMSVAVQDGVLEHGNNAQRAFVADIEEVAQVIEAHIADTEDSANDEGRFRRIKKRAQRVASSNQINLNNSYSVRYAYRDDVAYLPYRSVAKPRFTTLFCLLRI